MKILVFRYWEHPGTVTLAAGFLWAILCPCTFPERGACVYTDVQRGITYTWWNFNSEQACWCLGDVTLSYRDLWWKWFYRMQSLEVSGEVNYGYSFSICLWSQLMYPLTGVFVKCQNNQFHSCTYIFLSIYLKAVYWRSLPCPSLISIGEE